MVKMLRRLHTFALLLAVCFFVNTLLFAYFVGNYSNQKPGGLVVVTNTPKSTPKQQCPRTASIESQQKYIEARMP